MPAAGLFIFTLVAGRRAGKSIRYIVRYCYRLDKTFEAIISSLNEECSMVIGGPDVVVMTAEMKLGKYKYNRGRRVESTWVSVGFMKDNKDKMFCIAGPDRSGVPLKTEIEKYKLQGSKIKTDCWKGCLSAIYLSAYKHETVNHNEFYVDLEEFLHTNTVFGINNAFQLAINPKKP